MITRVIVMLTFFAVLSGCMEVKEGPSIPVPIAHEPVRMNGQIRLSASIIGKRNEILTYGFRVGSTSLGTPPSGGIQLVPQSDSISGNQFFMTLEERRLFPNQTYFTNPYVYVDGNIIYGEEITFSTGNEFARSIDSIDPVSVNKGDTFVINGKNFVPGFTTIHILYVQSGITYYNEVQLISVSDNQITAIVPDTIGTTGWVDLYVVTALHFESNDGQAGHLYILP